MKTLLQRYCELHQQIFVPIFVSDSFDAVQLAESCVAAGANAIEITCRRKNVTEEIRRIRMAFPKLIIMVGSVVDDGPMLNFLKHRREDMPSMSELAELGIDGMVSMMPMSIKTITKFSDNYIMVPGVETLNDAVQAVEAGAHFAKFFNAANSGGPKRISLATCAAMHGLLPVFVTGGITLEKIKPYLSSGTAILGSGWDVLLGDKYQEAQEKPDNKILIAELKRFLDEAAQTRTICPPLDTNSGLKKYLNTIIHYHPFLDNKSGSKL